MNNQQFLNTGVLEDQDLAREESGNLQQEHTIMVVDDDDDYCFVTKIMLKKAGVGKKIIVASDGLEALNKLQGIAASGGKLPAIIFLDLKMPVMDGFEFLEEATKSSGLNLSQTKIFVTTSSVLPKDKEKALTYTIAGFVSKPLNQDVLRDILI
jgi:CheY-like chemotaxis protein